MHVICRTKKTADYGSKRRIYIHEVFPEKSIESNTLQTTADLSQPRRGIALYMELLKEVLSTDKVTNNPKTTKHNAECHSAVDILWERSEPVTPDAESDPSKPKDYNKVGSSPINAEGQELADKGTNFPGNSLNVMQDNHLQVLLLYIPGKMPPLTKTISRKHVTLFDYPWKEGGKGLTLEDILLAPVSRFRTQAAYSSLDADRR